MIRPAVGRLLSSAVEHIVIFAPDMVVYHPKVLSAPLAADRLGIPSVLVESIPSLTPTREFPAPAMVSGKSGPFQPRHIPDHALPSAFSAAKWTKR